MHLTGALREKHGGLTRGIATADDDHLLMAAQLRFDDGRSVVHTGAFELRQVHERWAAVFSAGGDDHGPRRHAWPILDPHGVRLPIAREPCRTLEGPQTCVSLSTPSSLPFPLFRRRPTRSRTTGT